MKEEWYKRGLEMRINTPTPSFDVADQSRIEVLIGAGYSPKEIEESLQGLKFDDCYAHYVLLGQTISDDTERNTESNLSESANFI